MSASAIHMMQFRYFEVITQLNFSKLVGKKGKPSSHSQILARVGSSAGKNHMQLNGVNDNRTENDVENDSVFHAARSNSEPNLSKFYCLFRKIVHKVSL